MAHGSTDYRGALYDVGCAVSGAAELEAVEEALEGLHVDFDPVDLRPAKRELGDVICSYLAYLDSAGVFFALVYVLLCSSCTPRQWLL